MKLSTAITFCALILASLQLEPNSKPPRMLGIATTPLNLCANARNKGEKKGFFQNKGKQKGEELTPVVPLVM